MSAQLPREDPIRVLHVLHSLDVGGVEVGAVNLMHGLHGLGYEQAVCCLEGRGALSDVVPDSVPVWACGPEQARGRYTPIVRAARRMHSFQPQIVHARNCGAWVNGTLAWVLAGCPGRLVFSIHGLDWRGRVAKRRALLYRLLGRFAAGLVAVSGVTADAFAREAGIARQRFTVLHSGVDVRRFSPSVASVGSGEQHAPVVLGCVARLGQQKGHDTLIKAFAEALKQSAVRLELRLVGEGPFRARLQKLARAHGVEHEVRFLGEIRDVPEQLRQFDLFVLASQQEGRPTSIMEAMATGLPVIATRVGAVAELVIDGRSGILVAAEDVAGLTTAMLSLVHDHRRRREFGDTGRRIAVAQFSLEPMIQAYDAFYASTVGCRGSAPCRQAIDRAVLKPLVDQDKRSAAG